MALIIPNNYREKFIVYGLPIAIILLILNRLRWLVIIYLFVIWYSLYTKVVLFGSYYKPTIEYYKKRQKRKRNK